MKVEREEGKIVLTLLRFLGSKGFSLGRACFLRTRGSKIKRDRLAQRRQGNRHDDMDNLTVARTILTLEIT